MMQHVFADGGIKPSCRKEEAILMNNITEKMLKVISITTVLSKELIT